MQRPASLLAFVVCLVLTTSVHSLPVSARAVPGQPVRLAGHVLPALAAATPAARSSAAGAAAADQPLTLTIVLNRTDEAGFQAFLADVESPNSPNFHRFLSQEELANRFGPSQSAYDQVLGWLRDQGFALLQGSANRLSLTVSGSREAAEHAFHVRIADYTVGGHRFFANGEEPTLPPALAKYVLAVNGLNNLARPARAQPLTQNISNLLPKANGDVVRACLANKNDVHISLGGGSTLNYSGTDLGVITIRNFYCAGELLNQINSLLTKKSAGVPATVAPDMGTSRPAQPMRAIPDGTGQKIGLIEFDTFHTSDVQDYLSLLQAPASIAQLSQVHVAGGAGGPGAGEIEVLVDINAVMTIAPGALVTAYDGPATGAGSFQTMIQAMVADHVSVISNSWAYCEDQTTLADVQSIDVLVANAAASGITMVSGSGDTGNVCLDGATGAIAVPSSAPHVLAVGGTTPVKGLAGTYGSETWWNGAGSSQPTGQGGFGTSRFFPRPTYQNGVITGTSRSIPDVVAPADPEQGYIICSASRGGCPAPLLIGGTSVAAPIWAALIATINQESGANVGYLQPLIYPLAATSAFHGALSMGSDAAHVGLGSPNVDALALALNHATAGAVSLNTSIVAAVPEVVTADGASIAAVAVVALDNSGHTVSGQTVTLAASPGAHATITPVSSITTVNNGAALFMVSNVVAETVTFTATIAGQPAVQAAVVTFLSPPATSGSIIASQPTVPADGNSTATITVTLQNAKGQGASGKTVSLAQGNGASMVTATGATPAVTDNAGRATFTATDKVTEAVTYTATDITDGNLPVPGSATVSFTNGPELSCVGRAVAGSGYAVSVFASGFAFPASAGHCAGGGPFGLAFDAGGNLFVGDGSDIYKFGPAGGTADAAHRLNAAPLPSLLAGLAITADGRLYANFYDLSEVVELSQTTGAILRVVAPSSCCDPNAPNHPLGLVVDPLSGDLFGSEAYGGMFRVSNFANGTGTSTRYGTAADNVPDGLAVAPDGTFYVKMGWNGEIYSYTGSNKPQPPTTTLVATVPGAPDGLALQPNPAAPTKPTLIVNRNDGTITKVDLSTSPPTQTNILTGGSRGDFVIVGPDGCLYATQTDRVLKLTNADGTCSLASSGVLPQIGLSPVTVAAPLATGGSKTFTATVKHVSNPTGTPITFFVSGPNEQVKLVPADANGVASFTYTGAFAGADTVAATASPGGTAVSSNPVSVTWTAAGGKHVSFLTLNTSARAGGTGQLANLVGNLTDISSQPVAPIGNASVTLAVGNQSCTATTDSSGNAACGVTLPQGAGGYPLTATYAGSAQYTASSASDAFTVAGGGPPTAVSMTPAGGSPRGGQSVTISGAAIQPGASVAIGGQAATGVTVNDSTSVTATTPPYVYLGDTNGDGLKSPLDALCVLRFVAGLPATPACPASALQVNVPVAVSNPGGGSAVVPGGYSYNAGDVNGDATVNPLDALCILRSVAGLPATANCPGIP